MIIWLASMIDSYSLRKLFFEFLYVAVLKVNSRIYLCLLHASSIKSLKAGKYNFPSKVTTVLSADISESEYIL